MTAADNAGHDGWMYGSDTTIVPVECAGSVTGAAILRAFAGNADGVLLAACGRGDCHCVNGNESCERAAEETRAIISLAGIARERLKIDLSSETDGKRFAQLVIDFENELAELD